MNDQKSPESLASATEALAPLVFLSDYSEATHSPPAASFVLGNRIAGALERISVLVNPNDKDHPLTALASQLCFRDRRSIDLVARGLQRSNYSPEAVAAVVAALNKDLKIIDSAGAWLQSELERIRAEIQGRPLFEPMSQAQRQEAWQRLLSDQTAFELPIEVQGQEAVPRPQSDFAVPIGVARTLSNALEAIQNLRGLILAATLQPEYILPIEPVYCLETEELSQVKWDCPRQTSGTVLVSFNAPQATDGQCLDVVRTVEGRFVVGQRHGNLFCALDQAGRPSHEFSMITNGLWDLAFSAFGEQAPQQREVQSLLERGKKGLTDGIPSLAQGLFEEALSIAPRLLEAQIGRIQALLARQQTDEAIASAKLILANSTNSAELLHLLGVALQQQGKADAAVASLQAAEECLRQRMSGHLFGRKEFWASEDIILRASVLLQLGRLDEARFMQELLLVRAEAPLAAYTGLGEISLRDNEAAQAKVSFLQALEIEPQSVPALLGLARAERLIGDTAQAIWGFIQAAEISFGKGQVQNALGIYQELLALDPCNVNALTGAGFALDRLGCPREAAASFTRAGEVYLESELAKDALRNFQYAKARAKHYLPAEIGFASALLRLGENRAALESFERVLVSDPLNVAALVGKGRAHMALWNFVDAGECFDRVLESQPTHLEALVASGQLHLSLGANALAGYSFDLALQIAPDTVSAMLGKAQCALRMGDAQIALNGFESVLLVSPCEEAAINGRITCLELLTPQVGSLEKLIDAAGVLMNQGKFVEAAELYSRSLDLGGGDARILAGLGQARLQSGDFEGARDAFFEVVHHAPEDMHSLHGMAEATLALRDYELAAECFEKLCGVGRFSLAGFIGRGDALMGLRAFDEALDCYATALQIDEQNARAFVGKATAHLELGELDAAQRAFSYALGLEPGNAAAIAGSQEIIRRINKRQLARA